MFLLSYHAFSFGNATSEVVFPSHYVASFCQSFLQEGPLSILVSFLSPASLLFVGDFLFAGIVEFFVVRMLLLFLLSLIFVALKPIFISSICQKSYCFPLFRFFIFQLVKFPLKMCLYLLDSLSLHPHHHFYFVIFLFLRLISTASQDFCPLYKH